MSKVITAVGIAVLMLASALPANAATQVQATSAERPGTVVAVAKKLNVVSEQYNNRFADAGQAGLERTGPGEPFENGNYYYIIPGQADRWRGKYVALNGKVDKLVKLIIEQGPEKKILTTGEPWEVGGGWTLTANSIDAKASPRLVWIGLSKDGVIRDDKVVSCCAPSAKPIYTYVEKNLAGEYDVPVFVTYVDSVWAGATSDMVQLRYTWAVSTSVTTVKNLGTK